MLKRILITIALALGIAVSACQPKNDAQADDAKVGAQTQRQVMGNAINAVPAYQPKQFSAREDINWYLQETEGRSVWYVYALSMDGKPLFYVVSDMQPRNICISVTPPERVEVVDVWEQDQAVVRSAPGLDGVYYGGANCDAYYMRDAETGGMVQLAGGSFTLIASKAELFVETDLPRLSPNQE